MLNALIARLSLIATVCLAVVVTGRESSVWFIEGWQWSLFVLFVMESVVFLKEVPFRVRTATFLLNQGLIARIPIFSTKW